MMRRVLPLLFYVAVAALIGTPAHAAQIRGVRISAEAGTTRVVLDLSGPVTHSVFTLDNPARVVIDLDSSQLAGGVTLPAGQGLVQALRSGPQDGGKLRIVLDVNAAVQPRSFVLPPEGALGHRLVIDLVATGAQQTGTIVPVTNPVGRDLVIVIDPGHGGPDPGATGPTGLREKDIVLAISRELARQINAQPGMRAYLTRDGDYVLDTRSKEHDLRARMTYAESLNADLFLSIHADACTCTSANGATVYMVSQGGATNEAARRLVERENGAALPGTDLAGVEDQVAVTLLNLSQSWVSYVSNKISERVIGELAAVTRVRSMNVQREPFTVLRSPAVPSLLIETAFISNPAEERALADIAHQQTLATAIAKGVRGYFYENPPSGSRIEQIVRGTQGPAVPAQYTVVAGDTLSGIAQRHGVTVAALRSANGLSGDTIRVGQQLVIPSPLLAGL